MNDRTSSADLASLHAAAGNLHLAGASITDAIAEKMIVDAIGLVQTAITRLHSQSVIDAEIRRDQAAQRAAVLHLVPGDQA